MDKKHKQLSLWLPLIIFAALALGLFGGYFFSTRAFLNNGFSVQGNKINNIIRLIDSQYVDSINPSEMIENAIPQIIAELDPHSVYIPAKDLESTNEELEGSFSGIGVQFSIINDTITVVSVIPGGPSEKIGLMAGDRIVTINDSLYVGKKVTNELVMKNLRGAKGSTVNVVIHRANSPKPLKFSIVRGDIPLNSVDVSYMISKQTGYIKISKFGRTTYQEFLNALTSLRNEGASKYVIDLRGNTGGYMDAAILMVNEFLPANRTIVYTQGKSYPRNDAKSDGKGSFQKTPITVLMDEWSASASEIFAGAIQDNDRGFIVGRRSFGKGLVQQQIPLSDGSALRLTIARYYIPSGRSIQKEYKKGNGAEYEMDILNRFKHGEFDTQDSIKQIDSLQFTTYGGRTVYGGGGIMPDYFVPRDTTGFTSYLNSVINAGLIYQYAFNYVDANRKVLSKYKNHTTLTAYLNTQPLLSEFVDFAFSKGIKRRPVYIAISSPIIINQLYAYIARNLLGEKAFYSIFFENDKTIQKALSVIDTPIL